MDVDPALLSFLKAEESRSFDGTLLSEVEAAIKSYNGAEYGDEEDGRSRVTSRDVSESTDYMLTSILDAFVASGRVVEFEPRDEEDEQSSDDATEAMHYIYRRKSGYRLIHDWAKAGLLEKIGVVKSCVERKKKRVENIVPDLMLAEDLGSQGIIEAEETGETDEQGNALWHVVSLEETAAEFPDYFVPLEEFRISPDARDFDSAVYLGHITQKSLSDLVEMGFDPEPIGSDSGNPNADALASARDDRRSGWLGVDDRSGALRKVWLSEEYVLYDLNGDGLAERLCVHRVGNTVLSVDTVDYQPFEFWCPYPMQGRLIGQSLADKTMDIQRVNTVLERSMLDSLYMQLAPGTYVDENFVGDHTIDDLLNVRPGRIIRTKGGYPQPEERVDVSGVAMQAIEFKTRQRESRTGITRLNKGVDEDTLNDTAKGQAQLMARGQQMERYIIRNFAEGVARLFMKKVGLMRKHGQPFRIRVDGDYREVDPSQWPENMEVNVVVGLGSGSKEDRVSARQMIAQVQGMLVEGGSQIVTPDNLYNNATGICRDFGLQPNDLFTEPPKDEQGNPIPQESPPDPEMMKAQAELQLKQQAHESDMQLRGADLQAKQAESALKIELERQKAIEAAQLAREKAAAERQDNLTRMEFEMQMQLRQQDHNERIAERKVEQDFTLKKNRDGGNLSK